jgi:hypothetical protein
MIVVRGNGDTDIAGMLIARWASTIHKVGRWPRGVAVSLAAILAVTSCLIVPTWASKASAVTPAAALRLRVIRGPDTGKQLTITPDGRVYSIGRHENNDLVCVDPYVSRKHATVECRTSGCTVTDFGTEGKGSTNGTFVNARKLDAKQPAPLPEGAFCGWGRTRTWSSSARPDPCVCVIRYDIAARGASR